jgi:hypothetical protein
MSRQEFFKAHVTATQKFETLDFTEKTSLVLDFKQVFPSIQANAVNLIAFLVTQNLEVA